MKKSSQSITFHTHTQCRLGSINAHVNVFMAKMNKKKTQRFQGLHKSARLSLQQLECVKARLQGMAEMRGTEVDVDLHNDLSALVQEYTPSVMSEYPAD